MASSQREAEREKRKKAKNRKRMRIAWAIVGIVVAVLLVMRVAETDFSSLSINKNNSETVSEKINFLINFLPAVIYHSERSAEEFMFLMIRLIRCWMLQMQILCKPLITAMQIR